MDIKKESFPINGRMLTITSEMELSWNFKEEAELVYCKRGSLRVIAPDGFQAFSLREGEGVFIVPRTMNMIRSAVESSDLISISFSPEVLWTDSSSRIYTSKILPLMNNKEGFISLSSTSAAKIEAIYNELEEKVFAYEIAARDMLSSIMLFLIRERGVSPDKAPEFKNERLIRMVTFIKENYNVNIRLKDIADSGMVSEREALRTFSKALGESPIHFLISYRLSQAAKLLEDSSYNIDEIASHIGFESSSHFSRLFKRSYSLTPTQYRSWLRKS